MTKKDERTDVIKATTVAIKGRRESQRLALNFFICAIAVSCFCVLYAAWECRFYSQDEAEQYLGENGSIIPSSEYPLESCRGKEKYLKMLEEAGMVRNLAEKDKLCRELPTEEQVAALYGSEPIIHGLDKCEAYRANLHSGGNATTPLEPMVRVTGLFNTGTNAFDRALGVNLLQNGSTTLEPQNDEAEAIESRHEVPWFKHFPLDARKDWGQRQSTEMVNRVLTIVLVRDPYRWMQSMCKASYTVDWKRVGGHCPNLVPSAMERNARPRLRKTRTFPVSASYGEAYSQQYESLASMWSQWNREYLDADFPRLFVRFEDMLYTPESVMQQVAVCAGLSVRQPYRAMLEPSKAHGKSSGLVSALTRYGTDTGRSDGMLPEDIQYSERVLDKQLMDLFHYVPLKKDNIQFSIEEEAF